MNPAPLRSGENRSRRQPNDDADPRIRELRPVQARQGITIGHMRYVLAISVALVVAAFATIYFLYF